MSHRLKLFRVFTASIVVLGALLLIDGSLVSQANAQVVFTEVDYHNDRIEIVNMGTSAEDISNWQLCSRFSYAEISTVTIDEGSTNLEPGGVIVLSGFALNDVSADLGLYHEINNFGDFANASFMEDFVQWGDSGIGRESVAATKGIWNAGDSVPVVANGHSIEFDGVGTSVGGWSDQATPNFGTFGEEAFVPSVVINEVDYRVTDRIELKNISANPVDISNWVLCSRFDYSNTIATLQCHTPRICARVGNHAFLLTKIGRTPAFTDFAVIKAATKSSEGQCFPGEIVRKECVDLISVISHFRKSG